MALILAIDTTSEHGSLALARDQELLECHPVRAPQAFATVVFGEICALLARHQASLEDVDLFAAAAGPGSFTGVRVGLTAVKGLAIARGRPVAPISNLAATAVLAPPGVRVLIPVLDARRGEIYAGVYERGSSLRALMEEIVARPAALEEQLAAVNLPIGEAIYCGPDVERLPLSRFPRVPTERTLAGAVARLAWEAHRSGRVSSAEAADANYVRRSATDLFLSKKT